jgi:hypothetical protein
VELPSGARAKVRDEGLVILWTFLTLGIYSYVWYYRVNRELRDFGRAHGDDQLANSNPVLSILAVTLGVLLVVPPFVSLWKFTGRVRRMQRACNLVPITGWVIGGSLLLAGVLAYFVIPPYTQDGINKVWRLYPPAEGDEVDLSAAATPPPKAEAAPASSGREADDS